GGVVETRRPVSLVVSEAVDSLNYVRSTGEAVTVPVPYQEVVKLSGKAGERVAVRLGTAQQPNKSLIAQVRPADLELSQFVSHGSKSAKAPGFRYRQSSVDNM